MLNICMLSSGHSPFDERLYYKEALSLKNMAQITIIAPYHENLVTEDGIAIKGIPERGKIFGRLIPLFFLLRFGLSMKADVFHCHEADSLLVGYILKIFKGAKLVYDSHEYHPEAFSEKFPLLFKKTIYFAVSCLERFLCKKCDGIISVNEDLEKKFSQYSSHTAVIPNYPNREIFGSDSQKLTSQLQEKYLVYVGGLTLDRGLLEMLSLLKLLREQQVNIKLLLIGHFNNFKHKIIIEEFIFENGLTCYVEFTGMIAHQEVPELVRNALAGLLFLKPLPRYEKAEPIKLFEYMATGVPVISYDYVGVRNIIQDVKCGMLIPPLDLQEAVRSVKYLCDNPEDADAMGRRGMQAFQSSYNWDICETWLQKFYGDFVERARV